MTMKEPNMNNLCNVCILSVLLLGAACNSQDESLAQVNQAVVASAQASAQDDSTTPRPISHSDHLGAAQAAMRQLAELVGRNSTRNRGFQSPDEVASASPGTPLPVYQVAMNELAAFKSDRDPRAILVDRHEVVYPIMLDGEARTVMVVRQQAAGQWVVEEIGHIYLAQVAHKHRSLLSKQHHVAEDNFYLVRIPELGYDFLASEERGSILLTALNNVRTDLASIDSGKTLRASEVFAALQTTAANARHDSRVGDNVIQEVR